MVKVSLQKAAGLKQKALSTGMKFTLNNVIANKLKASYEELAINNSKANVENHKSRPA